MLLLNGHTSYQTKLVLYYSKHHDNVPFFIMLHTTYLLQLLDIVRFQLYKHSHTEAIYKATWIECTNSNQTKFLASFYLSANIQTVIRNIAILKDQPHFLEPPYSSQ